MRTTIDLDDELLRTAKALSEVRGQTLSKVISDLAWKGLHPEPAALATRNGFPLLQPHPLARTVTPEHVAELLDLADSDEVPTGMIRVLTQPTYRGGVRTPAEAIATLRAMKESRPWAHVFWTSDLSIADAKLVLSERIACPKQIADVYLAALALRRGGRLVTFDVNVPWQAVEGWE